MNLAAPMPEMHRATSQNVALFCVAIAWLAMVKLLPDFAWRAIPVPWLAHLSLPTYNIICQVASTAFGLLLVRFVPGASARSIGIVKPRAGHLLLAFLLAPALFVVSSYLAIRIAEPYLMAELAKEGPGASRRSAGAFGQAVTEAPWLVTIAWGAVLAALSEELPFRGATWSSVRGLVAERSPGRLASVVATVVAAALFGWMHAGLAGSVGIVRIVGATFLGLGCGAARAVSGTVWVSMLVHFVYNATSLAIGRGWFGSDADPWLAPIPDKLVLTSLCMGLVGLGIAFRKTRIALT